MTNNIIKKPCHPHFIKREMLIAAMILAWVTSLPTRYSQAGALLYLFSMVEKLQNEFHFLKYAKTGYVRKIQKPHHIIGGLTNNLSFKNPYWIDITAKNQNSVIHFINNNIKLFYSYFANYYDTSISLKNHSIVVK
jgi:hypothetical protein